MGSWAIEVAREPVSQVKVPHYQKDPNWPTLSKLPLDSSDGYTVSTIPSMRDFHSYPHNAPSHASKDEEFENLPNSRKTHGKHINHLLLYLKHCSRKTVVFYLKLLLSSSLNGAMDQLENKMLATLPMWNFVNWFICVNCKIPLGWKKLTNTSSRMNPNNLVNTSNGTFVQSNVWGHFKKEVFPMTEKIHFSCIIFMYMKEFLISRLLYRKSPFKPFQNTWKIFDWRLEFWRKIYSSTK